MRAHTDLRKKIQDYSYGLNDSLSEKEFTKIYKGIKEGSKEVVAIKVVDIKRFKTKEEKKPLESEIQALRKIRNSNIIHCLDVYSTTNNCYIITEFCSGGDLETIMNQRKEKLPLQQAISIFKDICKGYRAIYFQGYVHRNLNMSNILVKNGECKINGFSLVSKQLDIPTKVNDPVQFSPYRSPQSLKNQTFGPKCDTWALGVILYYLLHNRLPFPNYDNKFSFKTQLQFDNIPINAKQLIQKCLQHHTLRITFSQLESHEFISEINAISPTNYINLKGDFNIPVAKITCKIQTKITPEMEKLKLQKAKKGQIISKAQIGYMRFMYRLQDMLPDGELHFIVTKHLIMVLESLKSCMNNQSPFECEFVNQFFKTQRSKKMCNIIEEYCKKYTVIYQNFQRYIRKGTKNKNLIHYFDNNFNRSEGYVINSLSFIIDNIHASLKQIQGNKLFSYLESDEAFPKQIQNLAVKLDFLITYYQLNSLSITDWNNLLQFADLAKLDEILDNPPGELNKIHFKNIESKIKQLEI